MYHAVIAKMDCQSVEDFGWSRKFKFRCVYDSGINVGDTPENIAFTKATPNGEAWMTVDNQHVWGSFHPPVSQEGEYKPASQHYVVFIDAEKYSLEDIHRAISALDSSDA